MGLIERIQEGLSPVFDPDAGLAKNVTYIRHDGSQVDVAAVITFGEDLDDADWGSRLYSSAVGFFQIADLPWEPSYRDQVLIDSKSFYVVRILKSTVAWKLELHSDLRIQPGLM